MTFNEGGRGVTFCVIRTPDTGRIFCRLWVLGWTVFAFWI